ncbi:MAG: oligosaccharide flippase family protein [Phycisphaerae bacterium]
MSKETKSGGTGPESTSKQSLGRRSAAGFLWMLAQTLGSKLVGIVGQVILARLLVPRDYGLVAIAYMVVSLPAILRQTGIPQIIIQKGPAFGRWANAAFWMELALGMATMLLMLAVAPFAAHAYKAPVLFGLIAFISTTAVFNALMSVPIARLTLDLQFKKLAALGLGYNVLAMLLSVAFAWKGFGPYSFVVPLPICMFLRLLCVWWLAPVRVHWSPQLHRWWAMAADSGRLMVGGLCYLLQIQADNLALSIWHSKATVGQYFFAANLSNQVLQLLTLNLANVLFPVLSKLAAEPGRQVSAFLRAARVLALVGVPICMAEAVLARPAILVFFGAKWLPAVAVLQVLALAAAMNLVGNTAANLLQAQGRFHAAMVWALASAGSFTALVFAGSFFGGAVAVAIAGLIAAAAIAPGRIMAAIRPGGGRWRDIGSVYLWPIGMAAIALLPSVGAQLLCRWPWAHPVGALAFAAVTAPAIYVPLVLWLRPAESAEVLAHAGPLGDRIRVWLRGSDPG